MEFALLLVFAVVGEILTRYGLAIAAAILVASLVAGLIGSSSGGNGLLAAKRGFSWACVLAVVGIVLTVTTALAKPW